MVDMATDDGAAIPVGLDTVNTPKNPYAVALGRLGGIKGGKARSEKLTKEEKSGIARLAAQARWSKIKTGE
jgi:hypothetical protein